jgi:hypothetical protein
VRFLHLLPSSREEFTILAIFVDEGLICSNPKMSLKRIIEHLQEIFQVRTMDAERFTLAHY